MAQRCCVDARCILWQKKNQFAPSRLPIFRCYGSAPALRAPRAAGPGPRSRLPRPRRSVRGLRCARGSPRRPVGGGGAGRAATRWRVPGRGLRRHCGGARMLRHPFRRLRRSGSRVGARGGPGSADFFLGILTNARTCSGVAPWLAGAGAALLSSCGPMRRSGRRGTLTGRRCWLSRTLLRMWFRTGLALGQHQGFFALRFSQPPAFLPVGFSRGRGFSASCFRPVLRRLFPEGAVASSSQPRVEGQGCSRQRGGVNPVPHRQRAPAQWNDVATAVPGRGRGSPGCVRAVSGGDLPGCGRTEKAAQAKGGRRGERSSLTLTAASARCLEPSCVLAVSGANAGWKTGPALSMACPRGPRSESTDCE